MKIKALLSIGFLSCIVGANWAIERYGMVPVGFGLQATAGTYFAGVSFTLRDFIQDISGKLHVVLLILVGTIISAAISPAFALASGTAFMFSELADFAVYTPLRERRWTLAVITSNLVGAIIDSILFLWIAFGNINDTMGQVVGKMWMTLPFIIGLYIYRKVAK